jgi:hypothetical protein
VRHLLLHAAGNLCGGTIRLVHLHDLAALAPRLSQEEWAALTASEGDSDAAPWWMFPPLALTNRCFPGRLPAAVLACTAAACPPVLRWATAHHDLTDLSLSRLATPRLHGVEWSRTIPEAMGWTLARLYPGREVVAAIQRMALGQHAMTTTGWAGLSRWRKGWRILAGRAPRPATMYSVRRALDYRAATAPADALPGGVSPAPPATPPAAPPGTSRPYSDSTRANV